MIENNSEKDINIKIFVGNVPFKCSREEFIDCFKNKKGFVSAEVIRNVGCFLTRGFGFVVFDNQENVESLLSMEIILKDRKLRLNKYLEDSEPKERKDNEELVFKLFIKDIPDSMNENYLYKLFEQFGPVHSAQINKSINSNSGTVEFLDKNSFRSALNQKIIEYDGVTLKIYPFRINKKVRFETKKFNDLNSAYRAGFKAGRLVGYEKGYDDATNNRSNANKPKIDYLNLV